MQTVKMINEVRRAVAAARGAGRRIAFVPTMGALHAGHLSLIEAARGSGAAVGDCGASTRSTAAGGCAPSSAPYIVVSIYVNPTQFGPGEDLDAYPRTLDADRAACERAGVSLVFVPKDAEIYPPGDETRVRPGRLAETLCGPFRPGHFEGVCTVVARLFNIVQPDAAYFGQKDYQQALIIRRMVRDLCLPVEIVTCPLVRDADGLALSSRNARLTPEQRAQALTLYRALCAGRDRLLAGERSAGRAIAAMKAVIAEFAEIRTDYLSIVDPASLADVSRPQGRVLIAGAVRVGDVRLIDNLLVDIPGTST